MEKEEMKEGENLMHMLIRQTNWTLSHSDNKKIDDNDNMIDVWMTWKIKRRRYLPSLSLTHTHISNEIIEYFTEFEYFIFSSSSISSDAFHDWTTDGEKNRKK